MFTIIYFSPTGNTKHIAHLLAEELGISKDRVHPLEKTDPASLAKGQHLIMLYPIHGFNVPRTVLRFSQGLQEGRFEKVSLIGSCCSSSWLNWGASLRLKRILDQKGYTLCLDDLVVMPSNFLVSFPEKVSKRLVVEAGEKVKTIAQGILKGVASAVKVPLRSKILSFSGRLESLGARFFGLELHGTKACNSCGICWNNCPEHNIRPNKKNKPRYGFNCLMCMRCIYNCPQKAITPYISKFIPLKKGYSLNRYLED